MQKFTELDTLVKALDNQDFDAVKRCLKAGQSLNATTSSSILDGPCPLIVDAIISENENRFLSLIALRKFGLDLNIRYGGEGATPIGWGLHLVCAEIFPLFTFSSCLAEFFFLVNEVLQE